MGLTDIRPAELMDEQAYRFTADVKRLMLNWRDFVKVDCPACGSTHHTFAFMKMAMTFRVCTDCATIYASPRPTPELLAEYYATSEAYQYWAEVIFPASEPARRDIARQRADRVIELCDRLHVATGRLVEVGAGFGTFCEEIDSRRVFANVIAIEPNPALAAHCEERGLTVHEARIEDCLEASADVIVSFETLEHLFNPLEVLARYARSLRPGGLLVLTCPNGQGFDVTVLGAKSDTVDPEHLNLFNPRSLALLVFEAGFDVLEVTTPGTLDAELVRTKILDGAFDDPFLRQILVDKWDSTGGAFQTFLADNGLSSHMWLAARKP